MAHMHSGSGRSAMSLARYAGAAVFAPDFARPCPAAQARQLRSILDSVPLAIVGLSAAGRILSWNRAAAAMFGFAEDEVLNRPIDLLRAPGRPGAVEEPLAGAGHWQAVKLRRDGSCLDVSIDSAPLLDAEGRCCGVTWTMRDIGERLRQEREQARREQSLREQALSDPLTGVANRRRLGQALRAETRRANREGTPLSLVFIDLDDFKAINDAFGHAHGDRVLKAFAALVQSQLRAHDLLARSGGDEFVILMPNTTQDEAGACVERIRGVLQQLPIAGLQRLLTASFGISAHDPGEGMEAPLLRADQALYRAKGNGKNCAMLAPA
jgi:diguanylate cyclase (GGDEF)-like protein/PAS domain S-box-containing protein